MDAHGSPFDAVHVLRNAQVKGLPAEPLAVRILQLMGFEEPNSPNIWAFGGFLMALLATVASIMAGARMVKLRLQQKGAEQEGFTGYQLSVSSPVSLKSFDEKEGIDLGGSSVFSRPNPSQEIQNKKRKKENMKWATEVGLEDRMDLSIVRESDNWATARNHEISFWKENNASMVVKEETRKTCSCLFPEFLIMDERRPMPALFRPLLESLLKSEEFSQTEREEILNMNFKHAWELGKSKFRQWQQDNLPSFVVRGPYNSLFVKEDVVRIWDNLKGRALKTFHVQQGFASALDSQGILSLWDPDRVTSPSSISGHKAPIQGLCVESSNMFITGGPAGASGRSILKLWDTRMGPRPAAVNESDVLVRSRIFDIKPGKLHKLYVRHDAKTVSIHEMRMLGEGPISTMFLQDPLTKEIKEGEHDLLCNSSFAVVPEAEEITWWDEDAIIVSDDEESLCDEDDCSYDDRDLETNYSTNAKSVVSWCLGAVRSISSSLGK